MTRVALVTVVFMALFSSVAPAWMAWEGKARAALASLGEGERDQVSRDADASGATTDGEGSHFEVFSVPAGWCGRLEKRIWTNGEQA